ncbi:dockerin type I repeat-containing protein [Ruminococcus sp.]|uniref:dockerin type I repeat-containing protein n=1 Tax=Ruminococcus sp. TaxID=41978 RepID=UPI0025EDC172|nr:dockerin type I repeat-containing protein [Ruminococcus sp.]
MKMRFKRTGAMLLACAMLCGTVLPYAGALFGTAITANAAVAGKGTYESPYIVTTYKELKGIFDTEYTDWSSWVYVKLGKDIISEDSLNENDLRIYKKNSNVDTIKMHLDLAGHKLARYAKTDDEDMFYIGGGCTLYIDDSVGGGVIESSIDSGEQLSKMFYLGENGALVINDGTFKSVRPVGFNCRERVIYCNQPSAYLDIQGGVFSSDSDTPMYVNNANYIYIYGGTFIQKAKKCYGIIINDYGLRLYIDNCKIIGEGVSTRLKCGSWDLSKVISTLAEVTVDGTVLERWNLGEEISGNEIIIRSPKVIDRVNIMITEPKAGQNVSYLADTNDPDRVSAWGVSKGIRLRGFVRSWQKGDTVLNGDIVNKFEAGNTYTAKFLISTNLESDTFSDDLKLTVNGKPVDDMKIDSKSKSATFSITYDLKKQKGDVTGDGKVTATDVTKVAAHVKMKKMLTKEQQEQADIDGNGKVTITDLTKMAAHVKGKKMIV